MTENEMVGWHHQFNGHKFEQTPGDSKGQESLACCSPWGCNESDTTELLNSQEDFLEVSGTQEPLPVLYFHDTFWYLSYEKGKQRLLRFISTNKETDSENLSTSPKLTQLLSEWQRQK